MIPWHLLLSLKLDRTCASSPSPSPPKPSPCPVTAPASNSAGQSSAPVRRPRRPALSTRRRLVRSHRYSASLPPSRHPPPSPLSCTSPPIPSAPSHLTYPFFLSSVPAHLQPISTRTRLSTPGSSCEETRRDETKGRRGENILLHHVSSIHF
ncbi:hypothetical protein B0H14DRAFT_1453568 [Mycena olivaceomarginata]|nr:hypothetical protein B0H14DRAFT_1453568 [Mycena olivaceomarginata]